MTRLTGKSYAKIALALAIGVALVCAALFGSHGVLSVRPSYNWGSAAQTGDASIDASAVRNLSIDWAAGQVDVIVVDDAQTNGKIELAETLTAGASRAQEMRWLLDGDTLRVDYGSGWSCASVGHKDLQVRIPRSAAESLGIVEVDGASGQYNLKGFSCKRLEVDLASGQVEGESLVARNLSVEVASGQARIAGSFADRVEVEVASGGVEVACEGSCPLAVDGSLASGHAYITVPEGSGFAAHVERVSGTFRSDFDMVQQGDSYISGDGAMSVNVDLVSGDFAILKG